MPTPTLEERVAALELEQLKQKQAVDVTADKTPWWKKRRGAFKNGPAYREAMRLGREYRESLRPNEQEDTSC